MPLPYLDNPATLSETTVQELDGLVTKLNTFLRQQHTDQGGHGAITATSVVVDGPVTVRDELQHPSSFVRNLALGTRIDIEADQTDTTPYLTIRYRNALNQALAALVKLGRVGTGATGVWPGVRAEAESAGSHLWDMVSGHVSAGPAWMLVDATDSQRVLLAALTSGHYEVRPETFGPDVWLGTNGPATQRFARGYIDALYTKGRPTALGEWTAVPYNAADFTASAGTWTVDVGDILTRRYTLIGQTLHYAVWITATDVSAAPAELLIALPAGYLVAATVSGPILVNDAGTGLTSGLFYGVSGQAVLHLLKFGSSLWTPTAADNTEVYLSISLEVTG